MMLYNGTDAVITGTFSVRPPQQNGAQEIIFPPRTFTFPPDEVTEVDEAVGNHFLNHFGRVGLLSYQLGDDRNALRVRSRREWYRHTCKQLDDYQRDNAGRMAQGLPPLLAGEHVEAAAVLEQKLRPEFVADAERYRSSTPIIKVLTPEEHMAQLARRASQDEPVPPTAA